MESRRIIIIAQTPPPFHGQAIMQKYLVDVDWNWCTKEFVRMNFSDTISEVGTFRGKKIRQLFHLINRFRKTSKRRAELVYYPPSGPNRIGIYRDVIMLFFLKTFSHKILLHFHAGGIDQIFNKVSGFESFFIKKAFSNADAVIVLTKWLEQEVQWCKPKKTFVVENGIEDVSQQFSTLNRPQNNTTTFLFVGNLKKEKGIFTLLQAAAALKELGEQFKIKFVGAFHTSEEKEKFSAFIAANCLHGIVSYLGVKSGNEKWMEFKAADVFCLPTYETEGMPISILEAMMFSIPVITTKWRSIPDIIQHDENGLLFEPGNAMSLALCMQRLIQSEHERLRMGMQARNDYVKKFTVEQHLGKMEKVFQEVLNP